MYFNKRIRLGTLVKRATRQVTVSHFYANTYMGFHTLYIYVYIHISAFFLLFITMKIIGAQHEHFDHHCQGNGTIKKSEHQPFFRKNSTFLFFFFTFTPLIKSQKLNQVLTSLKITHLSTV